MDSELRDKLVELAGKPLRQPEIEPGRCVLEVIDSASCRACIESCPHQAWVINDDLLGLDTERCDGCAICQPACPQEAIVITIPDPELRQWQQRQVVMVACERSALSGDYDTIPCIEALGQKSLVNHWNSGIRDWIVTSGECSQCDRGGAEHLAGDVEALNRALQLRGASPIRFRRCSTAIWQRFYQEQSHSLEESSHDRRGFFRSLISPQALNELQGSEKESFEESPPTVGQLLPEGATAEYSFPYLPTIDPQRCNGCDACANLCPQQAVTLELSPDQSTHYQLRPAQCSGCQLCIDACDQQAITVEKWGVGAATQLPLSERSCRACGVDFHIPDVGNQGGDSLCRICASNNHHSRLFQVQE